MKSPSAAGSSPLPTGASSETGSWPIFSSSSTFSAGISTRTPISAGVGSRSSSCDSSRRALATLFIRSTMWTGMRIVRDWSASARVIDWRIHQVA